MDSNTSSLQAIQHEDSFSCLSKQLGPKLVFGCVWCLMTFISFPLILGIIDYNRFGSVHYQTILNKLQVSLYALVIIYILSGFTITCFRGIAPCHPFLCQFYVIQQRSFAFLIVLILTEYSALRYFYSCIWKHAGAINEDFYALFLNYLNLVLGLMYVGIMLFTDDYMDTQFVICSGANPNLPTINYSREVLNLRNFSVFAILICTLLIILFYILTKIQAPILEETVKDLFDISNSMEVLSMLAISASGVPILYIRTKHDEGTLLEVSPSLLAFSLVSVSFTAFTVAPMTQYCKNYKLRNHICSILTNYLAQSTVLSYTLDFCSNFRTAHSSNSVGIETIY